MLNVFVMDLWCYSPYYDRYLCESLIREGVNTTLASVSYYKDPSYLRKSGVHYDPGLLDVVAKLRLSNPIIRRVLMLLESCVNMIALMVRFAMSTPHVLHVQWIPLVRKVPFELWFLKLARRLGIDLVYTVHDVLPHDTSDRYRHTFRRIYQQMDCLICHTSEARDRLIREFSVDPGKVWIIPHGPLFHDGDRPSAEQARAQLGIPQRLCIVLWQGILRPYKGLDFLLRAWREVCKTDVSARLIIAGPGADASIEQVVRDQVARFRLWSSVQLELRYIPVEDLAAYYQAADILVYPYREVTTSGALMTGLTYQKPIVATALPCFEEVLRSCETSALVEYGDVDSLAAILKRLIRDPTERHRLMISQCSKQVPSWSQIANLTKQCYESVVGGNASHCENGDSAGAARVSTPLGNACDHWGHRN
jgi:glycosyltransferase involved in cell wall biosynthesis